MQDKKILRELAKQYAEIAADSRNAQRISLHRSVNDLNPVRPAVLIDELPWHEMNIDGSLTLCCEDEYLKTVEQYLRRVLFQWRHFPADMVVTPFVPVHKAIRSTGNGLTVQDDILKTDARNHIVAHEYGDILATDEDLEKLHSPVITYGREETDRRFELLGSLIGDIIPLKKVGTNLSDVAWDDIARYRGVTNLLIDLAERPEFMHKIVGRLTDIYLDTLRQYEALGLLEAGMPYIHCTPAAATDLPAPDFDGDHVRPKDLWGRGAAQIFASVSLQMHDEFDIAYMQRAMEPFGLVYYGCCEPLDKKLSIVEKLPHLRKISITPWADVNVAAQAIGKRYVLSSKPNPASVATADFDEKEVRKELGVILDACAKNGCACDMVLKDISTACSHPENIFRWEQIAMELVGGR